MALRETTERVADLAGEKYKYGFVTDIEMERAERGLNENIVRFISAKKGEPEWMLEWRLEAFQRWKEMTEPKWARVHYPPIRTPMTTKRRNRRWSARRALRTSIRS